MTTTLKIGLAIAVVLVLGAAAALYATPYIAVSQLKTAVAERDSAAISAHVDFPALRESMKASFSGVMAKRQAQQEKNNGFAALQAAVAGAITDKLIDAMVTPETVSKMMQGEKPSLGGPTPSLTPPSAPIIDMGYEDVSTFLVTVRKSGDPNQLGLVFTRDGLSWKLSSVRLPP